VLPIPLPQETGPNELLCFWLYQDQTHFPGANTLDLTLPQQSVRTGTSRRLADRLIWAGLGRMPNLRRDVPTIAVEFVSAGRRSHRRDYVDKRREYRETGIREYWIVDRSQRTLTVIHNRPKPRKQVVREKETYRSPLLPGFELPAADRLAQAE
jgi:hypothetical protein